MNLLNKKIKLIKKISCALSLEFPNVKLVIKKIIDTNIIFFIFYSSNKTTKSIDLTDLLKSNKFNMIDGGRKSRIIRKTKYLIKSHSIEYMNNKNVFAI